MTRVSIAKKLLYFAIDHGQWTTDNT